MLTRHRHEKAREARLLLQRPLVMKSSSCFFSFFSCIHLLFCRSAVTSVAMPPTHSAIPSTSVILTPGTAANAPAGTELSAMTGMQMREHHVA